MGTRGDTESNVKATTLGAKIASETNKKSRAGGFHPMRSIAFADFLIGLGILFVIEGLMFAAIPTWIRRAMQSALATPDHILRAVGIGSAVAGLILIWLVRR